MTVVDCSRWDNSRVTGGQLDFARARRDGGVHAVVVRWGTGNSKDTRFEQNLSAAVAAGLHPGVYWVPYPGNAHAEDAATVLADTRAVVGTLAGVAVVVDIEDYSDGAHLTRAEVDLCVRELQQGIGHQTFNYIPGWWASGQGWTSLPAGVWWESRYPYGNNPPPAGFVPSPLGPRFGQAPRLWQYTSAGQIPGLSDRTDVSAFFGTESDWDAMTGGQDVTAEEVRRELERIFRLPRDGVFDIIQYGQVGNQHALPILVDRIATAATDAHTAAAAVAQVLDLLGQIRDQELSENEKLIALDSALASMQLNLTDEQVSQLAGQLGVDYDRIARLVHFNVNIAGEQAATTQGEPR